MCLKNDTLQTQKRQIKSKKGQKLKKRGQKFNKKGTKSAPNNKYNKDSKNS